MDGCIVKKGCEGGKPRALTFCPGQDRINFPEKPCLLRRRRDGQTLKFPAQPHIRKKKIAMFVEMQKGAAAPVKRAARFFADAAAAAQPFEQRLKAIQRIGARMLHAGI